MVTSTVTNSIEEPAPSQVSLLSKYLSQFEAEQLALQARLLEFENSASEKEVYIMRLQSEIDSERQRRQDAEKKVQKLKQLVMEQHKAVTQLLTDIESNAVPETNPCSITDVGDVLILEKKFKAMDAKFLELAMERFQIQLEVEQITNQVFDALKTIYLLEEKSVHFSIKEVASFDSENKSMSASKSTQTSTTSDLAVPFCVSLRPKRKVNKPSRLVDELTKQSESNTSTVGNLTRVEPQKRQPKCSEAGEILSEVHKFYCLCTKSFESHAKLSEHVKHCGTLRSKALLSTQKVSRRKQDLTPAGLIKDLVVCVECGKVFTSHNHLIQHKWKEHDLDEMPLAETKVISNVSKAPSMETSIILLKDRKPRVLQRVAKRFANSNLLRKHLVSSHGTISGKSSRQWQCQTCKTSHKTLKQLRAHQKDCNSLKNSNADQKRRRKSNRPELKWLDVPVGPVKHAHVFAKSERNQFYCTCGTVVKTRQRLIWHIREKRLGNIFKCTVCPEAFAHYIGLKTHLKKTHNLFTVTETFGCKECGKTFDSLDEINGHRKEFHG